MVRCDTVWQVRHGWYCVVWFSRVGFGRFGEMGLVAVRNG